MKAFLLARVSTDEQRDALSGQTYKLIQYAEKNGYDYKLFELIESAYSGNRDQFSEVVNQIQTQDGTTVVVFDKVDRFSRDPSAEIVARLKGLCKEGKIELHFPSDNLIINKDSPATLKMILNVNLGLASYYSDASSDNIKRRFAQLRRDGVWTHKAPFGYRNIVHEDGSKDIITDGIRAEAVKEAFRLYASGTHSVRDIRKYWIDNYSITENVSKIAHILNNPFYSGRMFSNGVFYPHKYETLTTSELYLQVEEVRNGAVSNKKRWGGLPYAYRGLITCRECGCRITFEKKKGKYIYGHCTQYKAKHGAKYVNEDVITNSFSELFEAIRMPDDVIEKISKELKESFADEKDKQVDQINNLNLEISKYEKRLDRLHDEYLDGNFTKDLFSKKTSEYQRVLSLLKRKLSTFELDENDRLASVSHLLELSRNAPELFKSANIEQKRSMINMVLSNLTLDDSQLRSEYKKPFDTMAFL